MVCRRFFTILLLNIRGFSSLSSRDAKSSLCCSTFQGSTRLYGTFSKKPMLDFSRIHDVEDAVALFTEMLFVRPQPSVTAFAKLMAFVVKMKRYSDALFMFDEMRRSGILFKLGCKPDVCTFNTLLRGLFLGNKVSEAEQLFKKLLRENICEPNEVMLLIVLNGLCKARHTLTALEMLKLLEKTSWRFNVRCYSTVIDSLCKNGMVDDALRLLFHMTEKGISPDVVTYNSAIKGLCNFSRWKEAEKLLNGMVTRKISPNLVTYDILVDKEGMVKNAEDVIDIMSRKGIHPDIYTYNALILFARRDKARQAFDSALSSGLKPCSCTYNILMNGYCKKGNIDEAWHLFQEIPRMGLDHTIVSYNTMLHGLFREGRYADGLKLFKDIQARQLLPDAVTVNVVLEELFGNKHVDQALSFLRTMEERGAISGIITYNAVLDGLCNQRCLRETSLKGFACRCLYVQHSHWGTLSGGVGG